MNFGTSLPEPRSCSLAPLDRPPEQRPTDTRAAVNRIDLAPQVAALVPHRRWEVHRVRDAHELAGASCEADIGGEHDVDIVDLLAHFVDVDDARDTVVRF
jgi:hypothetical protein